MQFLIEHGGWVFVIACCCGFFMAWGIGANDVANAMGTSVGSRALTLKQAIVLAAIFEFAGAFLAGGEVTSTVRKGILDMDAMVQIPDAPALMVYGMLGALLAAGFWLLFANWMGWPVSTTHSIVGAILGFGVVGFGNEIVKWDKVGSIVASWVVSPVLAGTISFFLFKSVQQFILAKKEPFEQAKRVMPFYLFLVGFIIVQVTVQKGLKHVIKDRNMEITFEQSLVYALVGGVLLGIAGMIGLRKIQDKPEDRGGMTFNGVERICGYLMIFTACSMAFAHGSNDVANAVGPMAAIIGVVKEGGSLVGKSVMPTWILLVGGIGIVLGLSTLGFRVMKTIGEKITELTPSRGFAAELAAAGTVVLASGQGWPISTTHTLVGAVLGVGLAQGANKLDLSVVGKIFLSWIVTLPAGAGLAIIFFHLFKAVLGGA
jgi:PiT family inorganic phosphate transporter